MPLEPRGIPKPEEIQLACAYDDWRRQERLVREATVLFFYADISLLWQRRRRWFWTKWGWALGAVEKAVDEDLLRFCRDA